MQIKDFGVVKTEMQSHCLWLSHKLSSAQPWVCVLHVFPKVIYAKATQKKSFRMWTTREHTGERRKKGSFRHSSAKITTKYRRTRRKGDEQIVAKWCLRWNISCNTDKNDTNVACEIKPLLKWQSETKMRQRFVWRWRCSLIILVDQIKTGLYSAHLPSAFCKMLMQPWCLGCRQACHNLSSPVHGRPFHSFHSSRRLLPLSPSRRTCSDTFSASFRCEPTQTPFPVPSLSTFSSSYIWCPSFCVLLHLQHPWLLHSSRTQVFAHQRLCAAPYSCSLCVTLVRST